MTTLHYISDSSRISPAVLVLADILKGCAPQEKVVLLASGHRLENTDIEGEEIAALDFKATTNGLEKQIARAVDVDDIDIVHIHGVWGAGAFRICKWAVGRRLPVVVSPHKDLMPWNVDRHYAVSKLPQSVTTVAYILSHAHSLITYSDQESQSLERFRALPGLNPAKKCMGNMEMVAVPKSYDWQEPDYKGFAANIFRIYRKTICTYPFLSLRESDLRLEDILIATGISIKRGERLATAESNLRSIGDGLLPDDFSFEKVGESLRSLDKYRWMNIQLHANDQGVLQYIDIAAHALADDVRLIDVGGVERFGTFPQPDIPNSVRATTRKSAVRRMCIDWKQYKSERKICVMLVNLRHQMRQGKCSRLSLVELYSLLRYEEYNDYVLERMLSDIGMLKFTQRLLYILQRQMHLLPGYTPFEPIYDRKTRHILSKLFKSNMR